MYCELSDRVSTGEDGSKVGCVSLYPGSMRNQVPLFGLVARVRFLVPIHCVDSGVYARICQTYYATYQEYAKLGTYEMI